MDCKKALKQHKQTKFWNHLLEKYSQKNADLSRKQCELSQKLAALERQRSESGEDSCLIPPPADDYSNDDSSYEEG